MNRETQSMTLKRALFGGALGTFLLAASMAQGAPGELYIPAYNTLVTMVNERCVVVGQGEPFSAKTNGASVMQTDLNDLRAKVIELISSYYLASPNKCSSSSDVNVAFPVGRRFQNGVLCTPSLMDGIGENGFFTKVQKEYTASGMGVYANNFSDVPLLWVHFAELRELILRMKYTRNSGLWTANETINTVHAEHSDYYTYWETSKVKTVEYAAFWAASNAPTAYTAGKYADPYGYHSSKHSSYAYLSISGLSAVFPHAANFYAYAGCSGAYGQALWDPVDTPLAYHDWTLWDSTSMRKSSGTMSTTLGSVSLAFPMWCSQPSDNSGNYRGYEVSAQIAVLTWQFPDHEIANPNQSDPPEDGLAYEGCQVCSGGGAGGACPWLPKVSWKKGADGSAQAKYPLGASSSLESAGLGVRAYISEYEVNGSVRQMFSLDTGILLHTANAGEGWEFVVVKRPSGAEVLFPMKGTKAGTPDNPANNYRMAVSSGYYELTFPSSHYVVHRFSGTGLKVGTVFMKSFPITTISAPWPGMVIDRDVNNGHIYSVDSPMVVAEPHYAGDLVNSVTYRNHAGQTIRSLDLLPGSRIFRSTDPNGTVIEETHLIGPPSNSVSEIWYGVTTNPVFAVAKKEILTETYDSANGLLTRIETTVLNPDGAGADTNVTARVFQSFPWGDEMVRETRGFGGASPQTTVYTYGTNAVSPNDFGRLTLIEQQDGNWTRYEYDDQDRETVVVSPFLTAAPDAPTNACSVTRYTYAGDPLLAGLNVPSDNTFTNDGRPRLIVREALGVEVERTYQTYFGASNVVKRCRTAGATYDSTNTLTTVTRFVTAGDGQGRAARIEHEDGTLTVYAYNYDAAHTQFVTTVDTGAGDSSVTTGVRSISVTDAADLTLCTETRDIASGLAISAVTNIYDALGRRIATSNLVNGLASESVYACCDNPESTRDEEGISTEHVYDALKRPYASTRLGVTTYRTYDARGNTIETRLSATGMADRVTCSAYDAAGRLYATTNELGVATVYVHSTNAAGERVESTVYTNGSTATETYYRDGRLKSRTGTAVAPRFYDYGADSDGAFTIEYRGTGSNATEWVRTYANMLGQPWKTVYPDGYTQTVSFDAYGRVEKNSDGATTTMTAYNPDGEPFRTAVDMDGNGIIDLNGSDRVTETESSYTTIDSKVVRETVTRVYPTSSDATPLIAGISRAAVDGSVSWSIAFGRTNRSEVARDVATASRTETVTAPDGSQVVSSHTNGQLMVVQRKTGTGVPISTITYAYDAFGRSSQVSEPAANGETRTTTFAYDAAGNVTSTVVAAGSLQERTTQIYDAMGRRIKTILPDGGEVLYSYTLRGELALQGGARSYPVTYAYDDLGRMTNLCTYRKGLAGTDDTTIWAYDPRRGWTTAKIFANGTSNSYEYTANGVLKKRTWARGVSTDYAYDAGGSLTNIAYSDATPSLSYRLDRLGRVAVICDAVGVHTNNYAADGRLASVALPQVSGCTLEYAADPLGRIVRVAVSNTVALTAPYVVSYGYDSAGRLASVEHAAGSTVYGYAADGRTVTARIYSNEAAAVLSATNVYDGLNRLTTIQWQPVASTPISFDYAYNAADQRTTNTLADGSKWVYRYDQLGQVISGEKRWSNDIAVGGAQFEYTFDTIGNRISTHNAMGTASMIQDYTANELNQYTQRTVPGKVLHTGMASTNATVSVGSSGSRPVLANRQGEYYWQVVGVDNSAGLVQATNMVQAYMTRVDGVSTSSVVRCETNLTLVCRSPETFTYDDDGNLTSDGLWTNRWDGENRLIAMESRSEVPAAFRKRLSFGYDYQGRRTIKQVMAAYSNGVYLATNVSTFVYDDWNLISELSNSGSQIVTNDYVWGIDLSGSLSGAGGIGGLLSASFGGTTSVSSVFYACDGNGNVTGLIDTNGGLTSAYEYGPFAEVTKATGALAKENPFRFSTKYTDDETDLLYYGQRFYSPGLGRWLSRDPIGERGGGNLYGFLENDPVDWIDPFGLWKSWTHKHLTAQAWAALQKPQDMPSAVQNALVAILKDENVGVDSSPTYTIMEWHFNRAPKGDVQKAVQAYQKILTDNQKNISQWIASPSKENCDKALRMIGMLSHAWQDYYAHAVHKDYDDNWSDKKIGTLTGDPDHPGADMKPSSWGGVLDDEEHNWFEPGKEAPDAKARETGARTFTQTGYQTFQRKWWPTCKCFYLEK